jgi:hypothetical protein
LPAAQIHAAWRVRVRRRFRFSRARSGIAQYLW